MKSRAEETRMVENKIERRISKSSSDSGEYTHKIPGFELSTWKTDMELCRGPTGQVQEEKQLTLSWCHINAYGNSSSSDSNGDILSIVRRKDSPKQKHILKNVNGAAYPGELLVLMGSSGAGKTTLLNCLTFRNLKGLSVSGLVCMNNFPVTQTQLAAKSAYVQQDDLFIGYLTVKEHLIFQSMLKMEPIYTTEERNQRVEEVMIELSLKKCEHCPIGVPGILKGISGGERKRLALAGEFLTNPSILFCDEPTTGLDSFMALNVVQLLRDIARTGRTVITTVHQPSSELFQLFDKLCLMAEGRAAFLGTTTEASSFFAELAAPCPKNFNPADHYIQLLSIIPGREKVCKKTVESICDAFQSSSLGTGIKNRTDEVVKAAKNSADSWAQKKDYSNPYRVEWLLQFWTLLWRSWISVMRNPVATKRRFILVFVETLTITIIYFGQKYNQSGVINLDGVFFYLLISTSYQNVFAVVNTFCGEIPIFIKEHKDGMYRTDVYYLSKIICAIPISVAMAVLSTSMCYFTVGLNTEFARYLTAVGITILVCLCGQGLGFIVSVASPTFELAPPIVSIVVSPLLILGGIFLNFKSVPTYLQWLSDLSWFRYGFEAYMINQWSDVTNIECHMNSSANTICISNGIEVLHKQFIGLNPLMSDEGQVNELEDALSGDNFSDNVGEFWPAVVSLMVLAIGFRILGFFILLFRAANDE